MVALDPLEQMHAEPFELVGADAGRHRCSGLVQIGLDLALTQTPHAHPGKADIRKHYLAVAGNGNAGVQLMGGAGKQPQLLRRLRSPGRLVLGADQTLGLDDEILSKPATLSAAAAQLARLSGRTHVLHSAICLTRDNDVVFEAAPQARLTMRALTREFIARYCAAAGAAVLDSVGAYQLEGLGIHLFARVEGDHSTILGLPLVELLDFLRSQGYVAA